MIQRIFVLTLVFLVSICAYGQQIKKSTAGTFLMKNGVLHTVSHGTMTGDLLIQDGMIAEMGTNIPTANATVIDCQGKHIYPGFIDGGTRLGLSEVGSVSLTQDYSELGDFIPHMKALTAINPNSVSIPVTRTNGVTTVLAVPSGNRFSGQAALIDLIGYTPEQMSTGYEAVVMNFPSSGRRGRWDRRSEEDIKKEGEKALKKIDDIYERAMLYAKIDSVATSKNQKMEGYNPQMDALLPVVRGNAHILIEVNKDSDILSAIEWVKDKNLMVVFTGLAEGYRVAKELSASGIPVITGPVLTVPGRESARYDVSYANASLMQKEGVKVAIRTMETENVRNLPFNAAYAAAYGMGIEEALRAITLTPAEIFGIDKKYGSLDKGKVANLFVCDGDPFEPKTQITHLFIRGRNVPIENRHTLMYDEFLERDPGLQK